ncbi:hypothetical protein TNCV_2921591 [Trichonephila clavipes]|nr:hypothetical protein TNCV_2921591 [Trichonephila clavipes]
MNCQTKLRINHLTAVKSVAILENQRHDSFMPGHQFHLYVTVSKSRIPTWLRRARIANAKRHCFNPRTRYENKRNKRSRRKIKEGLYTANKKKKISKRNRRRRRAATGRK